MPEGLDEGVLHRFFCVLDVSENSEGHAKDAALMPPNEKLKGPSVASQNAFDQNEVAFRTFTFRYIGWFDHIGGHRRIALPISDHGTAHSRKKIQTSRKTAKNHADRLARSGRAPQCRL